LPLALEKVLAEAEVAVTVGSEFVNDCILYILQWCSYIKVSVIKTEKLNTANTKFFLQTLF